MRDRFYNIFSLDVRFKNYTYTSVADNCKISRFGSVSSGNLASFCNHSTNHTSTAVLRSQLINDKGAGTAVSTRVLWTGHIMSNHNGDRSNSHSGNHTVIITPYSTVYDVTYNNKNDATVRQNSIFTLIHELSHQIGAPDHYCYASMAASSCSNPFCYYHVFGMSNPPNCIMSAYKNIEALGNNLYCNDCYSMIFDHLGNHH